MRKLTQELSIQCNWLQPLQKFLEVVLFCNLLVISHLSSASNMNNDDDNSDAKQKYFRSPNEDAFWPQDQWLQKWVNYFQCLFL